MSYDKKLIELIEKILVEHPTIHTKALFQTKMSSQEKSAIDELVLFLKQDRTNDIFNEHNIQLFGNCPLLIYKNEHLATWLLKRSKQASASTAVQNLHDYKNLDSFPITILVDLPGFRAIQKDALQDNTFNTGELYREFYFCNEVQLTDWHAEFDSRNKEYPGHFREIYLKAQVIQPILHYVQQNEATEKMCGEIHQIVQAADKKIREC